MQKQINVEIFYKVTGWLFDDCLMIAVSYLMKRKTKKIYFEVISNTKIFNIIFFNEIANDQDFPKLIGGLNNVEYGNY